MTCHGLGPFLYSYTQLSKNYQTSFATLVKQSIQNRSIFLGIQLFLSYQHHNPLHVKKSLQADMNPQKHTYSIEHTCTYKYT